MLIKRAVLDAIVAGDIDTLFRRQKKPTVKAGGTLRTQIGVLEIVSVEEIALTDLTDDDVRRSGFAAVDDLVASMEAKSEGSDYRVRVRLGGDDPRLALRDETDLTVDEVDLIGDRLQRFDRASRRGPWTRTLLDLIDEHPHVRAPDLADRIGWETAPFKANVRKLKELGLTISHSPGYELSPRGRAYLAAIDERTGR